VETLRIVLPKANVEDALYNAVVAAFSENPLSGSVSIAQRCDHFPDYYYYMEMVDYCMTSPETLERYVSCYREVCAELCNAMPDAREFISYIENSFYIYSIKEIHTRDQADAYRAVLCDLELVIDKNRLSFDENRFPSRFEKRWCNRYVNLNANFNLSFLFPITLTCNKRCKHCVTFSPYLDLVKKGYRPSFEYLCRQIDKLFELVDTACAIQFAGGEPCIRQDLPQLIDYIGEHYKNRISDCTRQGTGFGIITNCSIDFSDELIEASKRFGPKLCWLLDDYHFSCADKIVEKLKKHGIRYDYRDQKSEGEMHCDGWVNPLNDFSKPTDPVAATKAAERCGVKQLTIQAHIANGKIYPCSCVLASDFYWPDMEASREYSVDMFDEATTREEKLAKLKKILCASYFHTCDKCKGIYEGRKRYYPAEQLTSEEYKKLVSGEISMMDFGNYDE